MRKKPASNLQLLDLLQRALQRVLRAFGAVHDLADFRLCDLKSVDTASANAALVDIEHNLRGFFLGLVENPHQDRDDEFHRRVIIIHQQHAPHGRLFRLGADFSRDAAFGRVLALIVAVGTQVYRV